MKMHKDEKKKREDNDAWMDRHMAEWRAKKGPENETVLKECETMPDEEPDLIQRIKKDLEENLPSTE